MTIPQDKEKIKRKIRKVVDNAGNLDLANLEATLDLADKLDSVLEAVRAIPEVEIPESKDFPTEFKFSGIETITIKGDKGEKGDTGEKGDKGESIKGRDGKDGKNGKDGINGFDGLDGINGKDGKDGSIDTAIEIRDKLQTLEKDERLDKKFIKGSENFVEKSNLDRAISILDQRTQFLINKTTSSGGISGLTVDTTTVTGGTNTRILFNNSGILGEYAIGTGVATALAINTGTTGAFAINSAAAGEIPVTNGAATANFTGSGIYAATANLTLGTGIGGITRQIAANGTATDVNLAFITKGAGVYSFQSLNSDGFVKTSGGTGTLSIDTTTYQAAGLSWLLASGGTLTGANVITRNTTNTLNINLDDASTNTLLNVLTINRNTTGTAASGLGAGLGFGIEMANGTTFVGDISHVLNAINPDSYFQFNTNVGGGLAKTATVGGTTAGTTELTLYNYNGAVRTSLILTSNSDTSRSRIDYADANRTMYVITNRVINFEQSASTTTPHSFINITQLGHTAGAHSVVTVTGGALTGITASTEATDINFNLAQTKTWATGALATQRAFRIQAPTYAFVGASVITTASTLSISGAPVAGLNATITNAFALNIEAGAIGLAGSAGTSGQVLTSAGVGATPTWTTISASGNWSLATGGTLTGTNTITAGVNPIIFSSGVTIGTGATAGHQIVGDALTTGVLLDTSSSSVTSGVVVKAVSTSTAIGHTIGTNSVAWFETSGVNANAARTAIALSGKATNTNVTSGTNVGLYASASGATTANYAAIFESGNIAIGTTSTSLVVEGATFDNKILLSNALDASYSDYAATKVVSSANSSRWASYKARAGNTVVANADRIGEFSFFGHDGTDYAYSARISAVVDGAVSANVVPMSLKFATSAAQSAGLLERMVIGADGNILIGQGTITANTRIDTRSSGTTGDLIQRWANSSNTFRLSLSSLGDLVHTMGATTGSGHVITGNSITSGNGIDIASNSLTSGVLVKAVSTSTQINHVAGTNALISSRISGANANLARTAIAGEFIATNTNATSGTNIGIYASGTGATTANYAAYLAGNVFIGDASATITASTRLDIRGIGVSTANLMRLATSADAQRMVINDYGNAAWAQASQSSTNTQVTFTQAVHTGGSPVLALFTGGAHTTLATTVEATDINFALARTVQFSAGAIATQRAVRVQAPTYAFGGSSTISDAVTFEVGGAPAAGSFATITRRWASRILGNTAIGGSMMVGVAAGTTAPTALLNLAAGTATASTAPLKFTAGTLLTVKEAGAVEYVTGAVVLQSDALRLYGSANNSATNQRVLYGATTDAATAVELTLDGAAGSGATNRISVPANTAMSVVLNVVVKQATAAAAKQMLRQFVISNNAGVVSIEGTVVTLGTDSGSAGLTTVSCTITANDTDDCIKVEVNGVAATNLRYTAYLVSTEVLYA